MYRLAYYINGVCKEVVLWNAPVGVCYWKKALLEESTHKLGELKVEKV